MEIMRSYIRCLLERARDEDYYKEASRIYDELVKKLQKRVKFSFIDTPYDSKQEIDAEPEEDVPAVDFGDVEIESEEERGEFPTTYIKLSDLGIILPKPIQNLSVGVIYGNDVNPPAAGTAIAPGKNDKFPEGAVLLGYNPEGYVVDSSPWQKSKGAQRADKKLFKHEIDDYTKGGKPLSNKNFLHVLTSHKAIFIHELVHMFDTSTRPSDSMSKDMSAKLSSGRMADQEEYFTSDHEMNAYFFQAFDDLLETFREEAENTQQSAREWAPNATTLWNKFYEHLNGGVRHFASERTHLKKLAARLTDLWENYVSKLKP